MRITNNIILLLTLFSFANIFGQSSPDYSGGFKIKLDKEGKKQMRFISFVQGQLNYNAEADENTQNLSMQMRRARMLVITKISPKFMVFTHFGVNSLNSNTISPTGKGEGSQLFMHDAWVQYSLLPELTLGAGLHYFNGISRLSSQSTLNLMTLDNNRASWATLGLSDQFGRHIGLFAKGSINNFRYQLAVNDAITNGLDSRDVAPNGATVYAGKKHLGAEASKNYAGYFQYGFLDRESDALPFRMGTYLGAKKVFNIGAGFFIHPKGAINMNSNGELKGEDVSIFAVDAFYDAPISEKGDAITAYAVFQKNNYGKDYLYGPYGTGNMIYGHLGYVLPGDKNKIRFQPYVAYGNHSFDASKDNKNELKAGLNTYLSGNNAKLTLEYNNSKFGKAKINTVSLQAMIYL